MDGINSMMNFLTNHWVDLLAVFVFVGLLIALWMRGKKGMVIHIIRVLVAQAEKEFGSGTGAIKLQAVWDGIYQRLPWTVRILFPQSVLSEYIEDAVKWLRAKLDETNANLLSYTDEILIFDDNKPPDCI